MNPISNEELNDDKQCINLPSLSCDDFIGRKTELKKLFKHISPRYRQHITIVNGIGGIGKTALVLQAAYLCQNNSKESLYISNTKIPKFKAIIFVSLKTPCLNICNEVKQVYKDSSLQYIFNTIVFTLQKNVNEIYKTSDQIQIELVYKYLSRQSTLLIIDNFEVVKRREQEKILSFLSNLPSTVQALITTREDVVFYSSISLDVLSKKDSLKLIDTQTNKKTDYLYLDKKEASEIYSITGGIPLAIIYLLGQIENNQKSNLSLYGKPNILPNSNESKVHKIFNESLNSLHNKFERDLLKSFLFFPDSLNKTAWASVADLKVNSNEFLSGVEKLKNLSLIESTSQKEKRYYVHSLICEYLANELLKDYDFEKEARARWVEWYIMFTEKYGGKDWENWQQKYNYLNEEWINLQAVLEWCASNSLYERVKSLWKNLNQFSNLIGYWHDRLFWLTWLIKESQKREDWHTASYCMSEKGFTLIQMGNISQAKSLLDKALDLEKVFSFSVKDNLKNQTLICQHFALLCIAQKKYEEAYDWLGNELSFIESMKSTGMKSKEIIRREIAVDTIKADIHLEKENYIQAESIYREVLKRSAQIKWHRRKQEAQVRINSIESEILSNNPKSRKTSKFKDSKNSPKSTNELNYSINPYG